jgi:hypothetical protein
MITLIFLCFLIGFCYKFFALVGLPTQPTALVPIVDTLVYPRVPGSLGHVAPPLG